MFTNDSFDPKDQLIKIIWKYRLVTYYIITFNKNIRSISRLPILDRFLSLLKKPTALCSCSINFSEDLKYIIVFASKNTYFSRTAIWYSPLQTYMLNKLQPLAILFHISVKYINILKSNYNMEKIWYSQWIKTKLIWFSLINVQKVCF